MIYALDDMLDVVLKITYNMIDEAGNDKVGSYEDFLKSLEDGFMEGSWLGETIEVAIAPLSGGNKTSSPQVK